MEKKSTRQAYGEALAKLGRENKDVVVLEADLSKSTMTHVILNRISSSLLSYLLFLIITCKTQY